MLNPIACTIGNLIIPGLTPNIVGTLGAAFEKRIVVAHTQMIRSDKKLTEELAAQIEKQVSGVLDSRSVEEFEARRDIAWPKYVRALRALSDTARNFVADDEFISLIDRALDVFVEDFEKLRGKQFTNELVEQAQFTLWTVKRLLSLASIIDAAGQPPIEHVAADVKLNKDFRVFSLWTQFHMDMALTAIAFRKKINEKVQHEIAEGMRLALSAYAVGEQALALRSTAPQQEIGISAPVWDEEDEELLASAMKDLDASGL